MVGFVLTYHETNTDGNKREQSLPNHVEDYISQLVAMGYPEDYAREYAKSQLETTPEIMNIVLSVVMGLQQDPFKINSR